MIDGKMIGEILCKDLSPPPSEGVYKPESVTRLSPKEARMIYSARYKDTNVAVKIFPRVEFTEKICEETKRAMLKSHRNLATVRGVSKFELGCVLVMDNVPGKSLKEIIQANNVEELSGGVLPKKLLQSIRICKDVAMGLKYLHDNGLSHGKIRPSNIIIRNSRAVLVDFCQQSFRNENLQSCPFRVYYHWKSPEYLNSVKDHSLAASDIFSLGMVMYNLFTGHIPFHDDDHYTASRKICEGTRPTVSKEDMEREQQHMLRVCKKTMVSMRQNVDELRSKIAEVDSMEPILPLRESQTILQTITCDLGCVLETLKPLENACMVVRTFVGIMDRCLRHDPTTRPTADELIVSFGNLISLWHEKDIVVEKPFAGRQETQHSVISKIFKSDEKSVAFDDFRAVYDRYFDGWQRKFSDADWDNVRDKLGDRVSRSDENLKTMVSWLNILRAIKNDWEQHLVHGPFSFKKVGELEEMKPGSKMKPGNFVVRLSWSGHHLALTYVKFDKYSGRSILVNSNLKVKWSGAIQTTIAGRVAYIASSLRLFVKEHDGLVMHILPPRPSFT